MVRSVRIRLTICQYTPCIFNNSLWVPFSNTLPSPKTKMTSAFWTVASRWATQIMVRPLLARSKAACTSFSDSESSDDVASSSRRILGSRIRARAMEMRCFWPPESEKPFDPISGHNEVVDGGVAADLVDALVRDGICIDAEADVLTDRSLEHARLLSNQGQVLAILVGVEAVDALAVAENVAFVQAIEAFQERDDGCFSAPRGTDEGGELSLVDGQVDASEDGRVARGVAEVGVLQLDLDAAVRVRDLLRRGLALLSVWAAQTHDAIRGGRGLRGIGAVAEALSCRLGALHDGHEADEEVDEAILAAGEKTAAIPEDEALAANVDAVGEAKEDARPACFLVSLDHVVPQQLVITRVDDALHREGRDGAERADGLGGELGALGEDGGVHLLELELILEPPVPGKQADRHRDEGGNQSQFPAKDVGNGEGSRNVEHGHDEEGHVQPQELLELLRIAGDARDEGPVRVGVVVEEDGILTEDGLEVLLLVEGADVVLQVDGDGALEEVADADADGEDNPHQRPELALGPDRVHVDKGEDLEDLGEEPGHQRSAGGGAGGEEGDRHVDPAVLLLGQELEEAAEDVGPLGGGLLDLLVVFIVVLVLRQAGGDALCLLQDQQFMIRGVVAAGHGGVGGLAKRQLLREDEAVIRAGLVLQQGLMGAGLDDLPLAQDDDAVGLPDGRQAVGDGDGGAVLGDAVEGGLDDLLAADVDGAGGLVEDDDLGLPDDAPGDGDALPLAARELGAAVADGRVVAVREAVDELVGEGLVAGLLDELPLLLLGAIFPFRADQPVRDVAEDGVVEEERLLLDEPDLGAPPPEVDVGQGLSSRRDASRKRDDGLALFFFFGGGGGGDGLHDAAQLLLGLSSRPVFLVAFAFVLVLGLLLLLLLLLSPVQLLHAERLFDDVMLAEIIPPLDETDDGALTGPGGADDGRVLAGLDGEVQAIEDLDVWPARVRKDDVLEDNVVRRDHVRVSQVAGVGPGSIDDGKELAGGDHGPRDGHERVRDALDGHDDHHDGQEDDHDGARVGHVAVGELPGAEPEAEAEDGVGAEEDEAELQGEERRHALALGAGVVDPAGVAGDHAVPGAAGGQHADAAEGLAGDAVGPGLGLGLLVLQADDEGQEDADDDEDEDDDGEGDEGQAPAPDEGDGDGAPDGAVELHEGAELLRDADLQHVGGAGDGAGGGAGGHGVEHVDGLAEEGLDVVQADGGGEADADHAEAELVDAVEEEAAEEQAEHVERQLVEQVLELGARHARRVHEIVGELPGEAAEDDVHQRQRRAGADGRDGREDVDDDIPLGRVREDADVVPEGRFAFGAPPDGLGPFALALALALARRPLFAWAFFAPGVLLIVPAFPSLSVSGLRSL
ncbi:hypothetical protein ColKHC_04952 [Colletotrichum higginsianum]|nr:hypothetical protein ColKHC_04952 [Colletotrichum higginsianum]